MEELKFKTFANSPKSNSQLGFQFPTQHTFSPQAGFNQYTSIPQQMQEAMDSRRSSINSKRKIHSKYPTQISLMKSDISMLSTLLISPDLPLTLLQLQVSLTEELLALREDKITLMEQHNRIVGERYKIQRELLKLKKREQKTQQSISDSNQRIELDNSSQKSAQIISKNQKLKFEYGNLVGLRSSIPTDRQQEEQLIDQIQAIRENIKTIEEKVTKLQSNQKGENSKKLEKSIWITQQQKQPTPNQMRQIRKLREKRHNLLKKLATMVSKADLKGFFLDLIKENIELCGKNDRIAFGVDEMTQIQRLQQYLANEQEQKQFLFENMRKYKEQVNHMKQQNQELRMKLRA